jgi:hypothetical protein
MSDFSNWLARKYPEYLFEQDAPIQQNAPAQSAAEILRQRLQKRAGGQVGAPMQQNQDNAQAAADRLQQRLQQKQGGGGGQPMQPKPMGGNTASQPNKPGEVPVGFTKEYMRYLGKLAAAANQTEKEQFSSLIEDISLAAKKVSESMYKANALEEKLGITPDMFADWSSNYDTDFSYMNIWCKRREIMEDVARNFKFNDREKQRKLDGDYHFYYKMAEAGGGMRRTREQEAVWEHLVEDPNKMDAIISAVDTAAQRMQSSSKLSPNVVNEAEKIEDYKTDRLKALKQKLLRTKQASTQQSDIYEPKQPVGQQINKNKFDANTLKKIYDNLSLVKKGNTIFWDNVGKMDKMNLYSYAKSKGINLNSNDIEENPNNFNQTLLNLYDLIEKDLGMQ